MYFLFSILYILYGTNSATSLQVYISQIMVNILTSKLKSLNQTNRLDLVHHKSSKEPRLNQTNGIRPFCPIHYKGACYPI